MAGEVRGGRRYLDKLVVAGVEESLDVGGGDVALGGDTSTPGEEEHHVVHRDSPVVVGVHLRRQQACADSRQSVMLPGGARVREVVLPMAPG